MIITQRDADGNPLVWFDPDEPSPVCHDTTSGEDVPRPLDEAEAAILGRSSRNSELRQQLGDGVAAIEAARQAAADHVTTATKLRSDALAVKTDVTALRNQVTGFAFALVYTPSQMNNVRDALAQVLAREEQILQALADIYAYQAAVDQNAVLTHNATLWLASLAAGLIEN